MAGGREEGRKGGAKWVKESERRGSDGGGVGGERWVEEGAGGEGRAGSGEGSGRR